MTTYPQHIYDRIYSRYTAKKVRNFVAYIKKNQLMMMRAPNGEYRFSYKVYDRWEEFAWGESREAAFREYIGNPGGRQYDMIKAYVEYIWNARHPDAAYSIF